MMKRSALLTGCSAVLIACFALALKPADRPAENMRSFAIAWLETLSDQQVEQARLPYDSPKRVQWHFIPKPQRKGLPLRDMNDAERTAALRLVRAALSEVGYHKTSQIMSLEAVLRELEGPGSEARRDPLKYYVTIFGDPANDDALAPWGLSFEGHHLSLNFVCQGDEVVDSTPQFFAANPAELKTEVEGPLKVGTRVLGKEEALAFELLHSMSDSQQPQVRIAEEAPAEIRFAGEAQPEVTEPEGIAWSELNAGQQERLKQLIEVYNGAVPEEVAAARRELIEQQGWDKIHFAWAGASKPGVGHYYRIQGPTFLIEFVNTQPDAAGNPANHIHCVWRDLTGDFHLPIED